MEREHPGVCQVLKDFDEYFGENSSCENWPTTFFEKFDVPNVTLEDVMYEYGKENLALVHLVIQSPYVTKIKQDIAVTFTTYVANTGKDFPCFTFKFLLFYAEIHCKFLQSNLKFTGVLFPCTSTAYSLT